MNIIQNISCIVHQIKTRSHNTHDIDTSFRYTTSVIFEYNTVRASRRHFTQLLQTLSSQENVSHQSSFSHLPQPRECMHSLCPALVCTNWVKWRACVVACQLANTVTSTTSSHAITTSQHHSNSILLSTSITQILIYILSTIQNILKFSKEVFEYQP